MANDRRNRAIQAVIADTKLKATEEYIRAGRFYAHETEATLAGLWSVAIKRMREGRLGPELLTVIVGVLGEMGLRGLPLPEGAMAAMNEAAVAAFKPLDPDVKTRLLNDLADRVQTAMPGKPRLN